MGIEKRNIRFGFGKGFRDMFRGLGNRFRDFGVLESNGVFARGGVCGKGRVTTEGVDGAKPL